MPRPFVPIKNATQIALFGVLCAISGQVLAGGFVDTLADIFSWVAIIIVPIVFGHAKPRNLIMIAFIYWLIILHYLTYFTVQKAVGEKEFKDIFLGK